MSDTPKKRGRPFGTGEKQIAEKRARMDEEMAARAANKRASTMGPPTSATRSPLQDRGGVANDPLTLSDSDDDDATESDGPDAVITVTLHKKYNTYPPGLRTKLAQMYRDALRLEFEEPTAYTPKIHYSVREGFFPRLSASTRIDTPSQHGCNVVANMKLMDKFLDKDYPEIKGRGKKGSWIELETPNVVANPQFMLLHSIRHGDIGWGFDAHGCLSFHTVNIEGTDLIIHGSFVQKMETIVKSDTIKEEPVDI